MINSCMGCSTETPGSRTYCRACTETVTDQKLGNRKTDQVIWGLRLMRSYGDTSMSVGHDVLFAGLENGEVHEDDKEVLSELGWHRDRDYDCWGIYL